MIVKSFLFLSCLVGIIGCGVMSNPAPEESVEEGASVNSEVFSTVFRINTESLTVTGANRVFVDSLGDMRTDTLTAYKIFDTLAATERFLTELNVSAQNLADRDLMTVESWIKDIKDANIDYQTKNLLFYPLLQSSDCGMKESISVKENNTTIIIQNSRNVCDNALIYHILLYEVDKSIENIIVKAFDAGTIMLSNKAVY